MRNNWEKEEINFIKENYICMSDKELSEHLQRHTVGSIATKRKSLGCKRTNRKYNFSDVINEFSKTEYKLLSTVDDYIDSATRNLKYICPLHSDKGAQYTSLGHLQAGRGCYYCGRKRTEESKSLDSQENDKVCREIANSKGFEYYGFYKTAGFTYINFICPKHRNIGIQSMRKWNMARENIVGCKYCMETKKFKFSKGEMAVQAILEKQNIEYIRQYTFSDCRDTHMLPFDFYLPQYNAIIEYDGQHHFKPVNFNGISDQEALVNYETTVYHDKIKDTYCNKNNIRILRIPYKNIKDIDIIITNFLNI